MKRYMASFLWLCFTLWAAGPCLAASPLPSVTLEECQKQATLHYPQVQQYGLIEQARAYSLENAGKGYLPRFTLSGRASYQSEVTEMPVAIPGLDGVNRAQYQVVAEVNQTVWDGGDIRARKRVVEAAAEVDLRKNEVDLYALRDRVNQLYFGILLMHEYLSQNLLLEEDLRVYREKMEQWMNNGWANQSDVDVVAVEQLRTRQKRTELEHTLTAYREMLGVFTGMDLSGAVTLQRPSALLPSESLSFTGRNARPEIKWFDAQSALFERQEATLSAAIRPRVSVFLQGGVGNPGLDMLRGRNALFYISGARLSWNLGGWYTLKNDHAQLRLEREKIVSRKETFLFNNHLEVTRVRSELEKYREQMQRDQEIIELRRNILRATGAKVENGVLSATDLIREMNAESLAISERSLHEIQYLKAVWEFRNTLNMEP